MKNKSFSFIIGIIVVLVAVVVVFIGNSNKKIIDYKAKTPIQNNINIVDNTKNTVIPPNNTNIGSISNTPNSPAPSIKSYTLTDVAKHASSSDCWTTINGAVYNVTPFISQHPGGEEAIMSLCGIDGSDGFNGQHGGQRRPASELANFKIGVLK